MYAKLERGGSKQDLQKEDAKENIFLYVISPKLNIYNFFFIYYFINRMVNISVTDYWL